MRRIVLLSVLALCACEDAPAPIVTPPAPTEPTPDDIEYWSFAPTESSPYIVDFSVAVVRGDQRRFTGEVHNPSSTGYKRASFVIQGRDSDGNLVEEDYLDVDNLSGGERRKVEDLFFVREGTVKFTIEKHHAFRE